MLDKKKWDFDITLRPHNAVSVLDTFKDLKELQKMGIANEWAKIDFNGTNLVAGIYDYGEQFLDTHSAIMEGDKQKIVDNLPKGGNYPDQVACALYNINYHLEKFNYEKFSYEEIDDIVNSYLNSKEISGPTK